MIQFHFHIFFEWVVKTPPRKQYSQIELKVKIKLDMTFMTHPFQVSSKLGFFGPNVARKAGSFWYAMLGVRNVQHITEQLLTTDSF